MDILPNWYISKIEIFQKLGFFEYISEDIEKEAKKIIAESKDSYFGNILQLEDNPFFEPVLLSYDTKKVWWVEDVGIVGALPKFKDNFYLNVFKHLESISNGVFTPKQIEIKECGYCDGRDKRLAITFQLDGKISDINFCIDFNYLVLSFLAEINEMLTPKGYSFESITDGYGPCWILFLSHHQKEYLSKELKWKFDSISDHYWLDRAIFCSEIEDNLTAQKYFEKAIYHSNYTNPTIISKFANFLVSQHKINEAIEIYEKGISNIKKDLSKDMVSSDWWLNFLQDQLEKLKTL